MAIRFFLLLAALMSVLNILLAQDVAQEKEASPAKMPQAKLVTLHADKISLSQALAEITKQTAIRVEDARGLPDETLSVDVRRVPFWKALDRIADTAKARINLYPTSGRIALERRPANYQRPPISYDGRFRLCVKKVTASRDTEIRKNDPRAGATHVAIEVAWDPELFPLYLETRPHGVRVVDDKNNALTVPNEGSSLAPVDGLIALGIDLRLPALPRRVESLRSLEGELSMIGPSKMLHFTFDTLDRLAQANPNDPERRLMQEKVTCHILKVTLDRQRWTIRVALDYPPVLKQLDTNQSWVVNNEMVLESLDGKKRFVHTNYVLESATARQAIVSYHFRDTSGMERGKPGNWRVSYRTPADLIEVPIKFSFKDIPLP